MFDPASDPTLYASQVYREAYARAVEKIAARQLGEAFIDLEPLADHEWREAA